MIGLPAPKGWETATLGDVAEIDRRSIVPEAIRPGTRYLGLEHLDGDGRILAVQSVQEGELASNKFLFGTEHILYGKLRPYLRKIVRPHLDGICSTDILPILPKSIARDYLYHYLRHPRMVEYVTARCEGANLPRLSPTELEKLPIHFPKKETEQQRIADILDKADAIRRKRRETNEQATCLTSSLFLNPFGNPVHNERSWPLVPVSEAGEVQLGRQRAPKYQTGRFTRPYMRVANVFEDRIDLSDVLSMDFDDNDFATFRLQHGDILLNEGQSTELVGRPAMWRNEIPDCCFQNTLVRFRPKPEVTEPEYALQVFLFYLHLGRFARMSSKTSSVAHLGAGRFAAMHFPLPPYTLQQRYAQQRRQAFAIGQNLGKHLEESNDLFSSLVQRAFRGEL